MTHIIYFIYSILYKFTFHLHNNNFCHVLLSLKIQYLNIINNRNN